MGGAVTGSVIYNHFSHPCSYRVHLDLFGPREERCEPGPAGRYLMQRGIRHEARVFEGIRRDHPDDWVAVEGDADASDREAEMWRRAEATAEHLRAGVGWILHGFLHTHPGSVERHHPGGGRDPSDLVFRGETDLLVRVDEPSDLGDFSYVVGDVKSSRHAKLAQKMQVTFYSVLLARIQGVMPKTGFIITASGEREDFDTDETLWSLRHFLEEEVHEFSDAASVSYHLAPGCRFCHWREHCMRRAEDEDDISLVPGARRADKAALAAAGIRTRAELLAQDDAELRRLGRAYGRRLDGFRDLKQLASAQAFGRAVVRQHPRSGSIASRRHAAAAPDLFRHRGPLLLIGSIPDHLEGDEAALATCLVRHGEIGEKTGPAVRTYSPGAGDAPVDVLRRLYSEVAAANRLLAGARQAVLPVFLDHRLPFRLRRLAEEVGVRRAAAPAWLEKLLADAVILSELVHRTWYLPADAADLDAMADRLEPGTRRRSSRDAEALREFLAGLEIDGGAAEVCVAAIDDLAGDYGMSLPGGDEPVDLRPVLVREWRETRGEPWRYLLEFELHEDLRLARGVLRRLLSLAA